LIVDQSEETREVLRTALERPSTRILEASRADRGLELAREHHPDVIVLDLEIDAASLEGLAADYNAESQAHQTPLVLLGSARRVRQNFPDGQFVVKPYHYGPLIRKIELLLEGAAEPTLSGSAQLPIRHDPPMAGSALVA
jgi:DNA-binding response OmpR family regulator